MADEDDDFEDFSPPNKKRKSRIEEKGGHTKSNKKENSKNDTSKRQDVTERVFERDLKIALLKSDENDFQVKKNSNLKSKTLPIPRTISLSSDEESQNINKPEFIITKLSTEVKPSLEIATETKPGVEIKPELSPEIAVEIKCESNTKQVLETKAQPSPKQEVETKVPSISKHVLEVKPQSSSKPRSEVKAKTNKSPIASVKQEPVVIPVINQKMGSEIKSELNVKAKNKIELGKPSKSAANSCGPVNYIRPVSLPSTGLRLGLSRKACIKPLHSNVKTP